MYRSIYKLFLDLRTDYEGFDIELKELLERLAQIVGADFGFIGLVARARNRFLASSIFIKAGYRIDLELEKERCRNVIEHQDLNKPKSSTTAWVISNNKPVLTPDSVVGLKEYFDAEGIGYTRIRDSKSCLCVPLKYTCKYPGGEQELVIGVIEFESDKAARFKKRHLRFVLKAAALFGNRLWRNHRNKIIDDLKQRIIDDAFDTSLIDIIFESCRDTIFSDVGIITRYKPDVNPDKYPPQECDKVGLLGKKNTKGTKQSGMLFYSHFSHETELKHNIKIDDALYDRKFGRVGVTWESANR